MAVRTRQSNNGLAALIREARWLNGEFARAVNKTGTEMGLRLRYDDSAVCHWLTGTMPRPRARAVILETLSRRLRRPVTPSEAGFDPPTQISPESDTDALNGLVELGSADMDPSRRSVLGAGLYSVALTIPGWPDTLERFERLTRDPHTRIGHRDVEAVTAMTEKLSEVDDQFGGRTARPMAAAFLVNTIAPYLRADAPDDVRRAMLTAAAEHCYVTGYMAMDERADSLAQRYYTKAMELALAAEDHLTYCTALRGMSVQAIDLGHNRYSLELAEAASAATPQAGPRMRAFLAGQHAHAVAATGDSTTALAKIREAELAMERAETKPKAVGSFSFSALSYVTAQVRYELGDKASAVNDMERSERSRESVYRRTRVRFTGLQAERKLELGRLDEACADWHRVLDDYPYVKSGRCDDRFARMMSSLRPHLRNANARTLHDRARSMAPTTTTRA